MKGIVWTRRGTGFKKTEPLTAGTIASRIVQLDFRPENLLHLIELEPALSRLFELVLLLALWRIAPPLIAFSVYFNAHHSLRHIIRVAEVAYSSAKATVSSEGKTGVMNPLVRVAAMFTGATIVLGLLCMLMFRLSGGLEGLLGGAAMASVIRVLFAGLSVITTPHLFLVECLNMGQLPDTPLTAPTTPTAPGVSPSNVFAGRLVAAFMRPVGLFRSLRLAASKSKAANFVV